jgi:hypothetical protein
MPMLHKINAPLNEGEQLHNLRSYLLLREEGIIHEKQEIEQQVTARGLEEAIVRQLI